jgi:hypothetical protein
MASLISFRSKTCRAISVGTPRCSRDGQHSVEIVGTQIDRPRGVIGLELGAAIGGRKADYRGIHPSSQVIAGPAIE